MSVGHLKAGIEKLPLAYEINNGSEDIVNYFSTLPTSIRF
jgi:hypothetical protein